MVVKVREAKDSVSLAEAAATARKCVETIYRLVRSRRIEATKDADGNWRIPRKALEDYYGRRDVSA